MSLNYDEPPVGSSLTSDSQFTQSARLGREQDEQISRHDHHLPEHCTFDYCLDCGRSNDGQGAACHGCLRVMAKAYVELTTTRVAPDDGWGHRVAPEDHVGSFDIGTPVDAHGQPIPHSLVQNAIDEVSGLVDIKHLRDRMQETFAQANVIVSAVSHKLISTAPHHCKLARSEEIKP